MSALRAIAVVKDYAGLHATFRNYIEDIGVSRATIDHETGWADGLAGKTLAQDPKKFIIGPLSLGRFLEATGLRLIVAQDLDAFEKRRHRLTKRQKHQVRPNNQANLANATIDLVLNRLAGKKGSIRRLKSALKATRSTFARNAAKAKQELRQPKQPRRKRRGKYE